MALSIATFNVKNLLEPTSDAARAVLPRKLEAIAEVLRACDADVVGLQGIGSAALLSQVLDRLPGRGGYGEPVMGTVNRRGIGCALLSRVPVAAARVHTCDALPFPVFRDGDPLALRGAHSPAPRHRPRARPGPGPGPGRRAGRPLQVGPARAGARRGGRRARARHPARARGGALRSQALARRRGPVPARLRGRRALGRSGRARRGGGRSERQPSTPGRTGPSRRRSGGPARCLGPHPPSAARFTTLHAGRRMQIDHVLVTGPLQARLQQARILERVAARARAVARVGDETPTADSDHAPLVVRFG